MHDLIDIIRCHPRFDGGCCNVQDFASESADLSHGILTCLIKDGEFGSSIIEGLCALWNAILPVIWMLDGGGDCATLGEWVDGSERAGEFE